MKAQLKKVLEAYFESHCQAFGKPPQAVRCRGMDVPGFDVEYGCFGFWRPEEARFSIPKEELEGFFGVSIPEDLYEYYRYWRFAALEFSLGDFLCMMDPVYETVSGKTSFFFTLPVEDTLYFKIGIAENKIDQRTYAIVVSEHGGVYLLEDGTDLLTFLQGSIYRLLEESGA